MSEFDKQAQRFAVDEFQQQSDRFADDGFLTRVGRSIAAIPGAVAGAVEGQQDPEFADVPGFDPSGIGDLRIRSALNRARVLGVDDETFGRLTKEALGDRLVGVEKDRFGQEVISFRDDQGNIQRQFINKPGLDLDDIGRTFESSLPFMAAGGVVGGLTRGAPLLARAAAQVPGQAVASGAQDLAAGNQVDLPKAGVAAAGGAVGELFSPAVAGFIRTFRGVRGLAKNGKLTPRGRQAVRQAGITDEEITPEFVEQLSSPEAARSADDFQSVMQAQQEQFGVQSSIGQRTMDPDSVAFEQAARRGLLGETAKNTARSFDEAQRSQVVAGARQVGGELGGEAPETIGQAGEILQRGLGASEDEAQAAISEAFGGVNPQRVFPRGIPKGEFEELGSSLRRELGNRTLSQRRTPAALEAVELLDDFAKGRVREPQVDLLKKGAPIKSNFDTVRRDLNEIVGDAQTPQDVRAAMRIKTVYNQWIAKMANGALKTANPEEFAKLQAAIGLTAKTKALFEAQGAKDFGGKMIQKIMNEADSPEGAIATMLTTSFKQPPKRGAVDAAKRMQTILMKEQPEAWHAMRQAYWLKMTRIPALERAGPITREQMDTAFGQISRNIEDAMSNQQSLVKVLYSPDEIKQMRSFGRTVRQAQAPNLNPSGTAAEAQRFRQGPRDNVLTVMLRRQAAGQQIRGNAVKATLWRVMTKRAIALFGFRGEGIAGRAAERAFQPGRVPRRPSPSVGGFGAAAAVQANEP